MKPSNVIFLSNFNRGDWRDKWAMRDVPKGTTSSTCVQQLNNHLTIRIRQNRDQRIVTGHISTQDTFSFQYGYAEARMRFFGPEGAHSAFWLQSLVPYATNQDTEVNIAEHFGKRSIWQNVYWSETGLPPEKDAPSFKEKTEMLDPTVWHVYGCEVTPMGYTFSIDGIITAYAPIASNAWHYLVLSFIADDWERKNLVKPFWQYRTQIDYVKVESR